MAASSDSCRNCTTVYLARIREFEFEFLTVLAWSRTKGNSYPSPVIPVFTPASQNSAKAEAPLRSGGVPRALSLARAPVVGQTL